MTTFISAQKKYKQVPGCYNELSGEQLIGIADLFARNLTEDAAKFEGLRVLLDISAVKYGLIPVYDKVGMLEHIDWIFEKNKLTEQVLPHYEEFWGPAKEFENLTLAEFHFSEVYYRQLAIEKDDHALDKLVAVLYRKPKPGYDRELNSDGDIRKVFNANEVEYYSKKIKRWPVAVKLAVIMFYDGCRQNLLEIYDEIFNGDSGEDNDEGMFGIIRGLSGDKYGDIEKVEALNIHTALYELTLQLKEAEDLKSNTPTT